MYTVVGYDHLLYGLVYTLNVKKLANLYSFSYISNKVQHYTVYIFLEYCSICFGWYLHPSSGAQITVFTVSGTCQTIIATCSYYGRVETALHSQPAAAGSSNGLTSTRHCKYSCLCSWWWVEITPETCRSIFQKKINCNIASCWKYFKRNILAMHRPLNVKFGWFILPSFSFSLFTRNNHILFSVWWSVESWSWSIVISSVTLWSALGHFTFIAFSYHIQHALSHICW